MARLGDLESRRPRRNAIIRRLYSGRTSEQEAPSLDAHAVAMHAAASRFIECPRTYASAGPGATRDARGSSAAPAPCWPAGAGHPSAAGRSGGAARIALWRRGRLRITSFSSSPVRCTSSAPALGLTQSQSIPCGDGNGSIRLHRDLEPPSMQGVDQLAGPVAAAVRLRCRPQTSFPPKGPPKNPPASFASIRAANSSALSNRPPPPRPLPQTPCRRTGKSPPHARSSHPDHRLHPAKRQKTAARPVCAPSPCSV